MPGAASGEARKSGRKRRRRPGSGRPGELSVIEQMAARPKVLQTLPPEGVVLEELIDAMREEYGYPTTPQEYRLVLRVAPEEPERGSGRRRAQGGAAAMAAAVAERGAVAEGEEAAAAGEGAEVTVPAKRRVRRRRRGRSRGSAAASGLSGDQGTGGDGGNADTGSGGSGDAGSDGERAG
ncbi:MAG TPA: hypothetical protein VHA57_08020 [Actinomycetota bacterium]|nr:hypothetical protein [Actinomycetota bacterium]